MQRPNFKSVTACIKIPVKLQTFILHSNIMHGAFRTDVLVDLSNTAWTDIPPHRSNAHTHMKIKSLKRPFMVKASLVIMKLNCSALLSCNLCSNQYNPHLTHSGLTPLTPHTVSNSLSVGLNKAKWQVSRDVTTPPCQSAMSGCCRLPGTEVFYLALRRTGVLCNSTREGMPKVF